MMWTNHSSYKVRVSLSRRFIPVEKLRQGIPVLIVLGAFFVLSAARDDVPNSLADFAEAKNLVAKKRWADAVIAYKNILKGDPAYTPASVELARALTHLSRREEAIGVLNHALQYEKGSDRTVLIRQARVLSRLFLTKESVQSFQVGLNLLFTKKFRAAKDRFYQVLQDEPDNIEILVRLGQCLLLEGDPDSSAERLRLAKKLNPYEPEVNLWLGRALHQRGELSQAIEELRSARADLKDSEVAPLWLSEALLDSGQRGVAIEILDTDVKAHPFHLGSLLASAQLRYRFLAKDLNELWGIRKELQLALSRAEEYASPKFPRTEGELGLELRDPARLQIEAQALLKKVEARIQGQRGTESYN